MHLAALNGIDFTGSVQVLQSHQCTVLARSVSASGAKALQIADESDGVEDTLGITLVHEALSGVDFIGNPIKMRAWIRRMSGMLEEGEMLTPKDIVVEPHSWESCFWEGHAPSWAKPKGKRGRKKGTPRASRVNVRWIKVIRLFGFIYLSLFPFPN